MNNRIYLAALIAINLTTFCACSLEAPPLPSAATSLSEGNFPADFDWKLTSASVVSAESIGEQAVVIRRDNGDIVYRGTQDYSADVRLPALLGQKQWIISDTHGNELRRIAISGEIQ